MLLRGRLLRTIVIFLSGFILGLVMQTQLALVGSTSGPVSKTKSFATHSTLSLAEPARMPEDRSFPPIENAPRTNHVNANLLPSVKQSSDTVVHTDSMDVPITLGVSRTESPLMEPPVEELAANPQAGHDTAMPHDAEDVEAELRLESESGSALLPTTGDAGLLEHERR